MVRVSRCEWQVPNRDRQVETFTADAPAGCSAMNQQPRINYDGLLQLCSNRDIRVLIDRVTVAWKRVTGGGGQKFGGICWFGLERTEREREMPVGRVGGKRRGNLSAFASLPSWALLIWFGASASQSISTKQCAKRCKLFGRSTTS